EPITNPEPPPDRELYQGVRITQWGARPIFGSLGAYPMSRVVGATMASSAGTSVSPAWPTGTTAGHRGLLWVYNRDSTYDLWLVSHSTDDLRFATWFLSPHATRR